MVKPRTVVKKALTVPKDTTGRTGSKDLAGKTSSKDTTGKVGSKKDSSVAAGMLIAPSSPGSPVVAASPLVTASPAHPDGPEEITLWRLALAESPYFPFLGRPVLQKEAIHRPNSKDSLFYLLLGILFYFALLRIFFEKYSATC